MSSSRMHAAEALLLLLLPIVAVCASDGNDFSSTRRRRRGFPLPRRSLQEDQDGLTCELVDTKTLTRLIAGHDNFVNDLFGSTRRRRKQRRARQLQDTAAASSTLLLTYSLPSADGGSGGVGSRDLEPPGRHTVEIGTEGGSDRVKLKGVKTQYRILVSDSDGENDSDIAKLQPDTIMAPTLLASSTESVRNYVRTNYFWGVAISGKILKPNGKKVRYQALLFGVDNDAAAARNATAHSVFLYVDKRSTTKNMRRDKRKVAQSAVDGLKGRDVACSDPLQHMDDKCRREVVEEYRVSEVVLKEPFQAILKEADLEVAKLDVWRFQNLYRAAAECAAQASDQEWNPRLIMDCVDAEKPRLYETYLVNYGELRNTIEEQTVTRNVAIERLKLSRNADIRACCRAPQGKNNKEDNKNNRHLEMATTKKRNSHTIPWSTLWRKDADVWAPPPKELHQQHSAVSVVPATTTGPTRLTEPFRRRRGLQNSNDGDNNQCQFIGQVNQEEVDSLAGFSEELYRSLTSSAKEEPAPADAFVTKGYETDDTKAQTLKFRKNAFQIEVRKVETADLDITNLLETSEDVPRSISRFVRDGDFEATLVEGTQTKQDDGTTIEFVGVIFSRSDKKRQLLWPVDTALLDNDSNAAARRQLQEEVEGAYRYLQTVDTNTGTVSCTATQTLNDVCVADAQQAYEQKRTATLEEEQNILAEIQVRREGLNVSLLDDYRKAGAECASELEEDGEGWNVTLLALCLLEEKAADISEAYLTNILDLYNSRVKVARDTSAAIAVERLARDNALVNCCEEQEDDEENNNTSAPTGGPTATPNSLPVTSRAPTGSPFQNESVVPTTLTTRSPTIQLLQGPTKAPMLSQANQTALPTASTTLSPSFMPMQGPTRAPMLSPTNQTALPTASPTLSPSSMPMQGPTRAPMLSPTSHTILPTASPTLSPSSMPTSKPTSRPTLGPTSKPSMAPTARPTVSPTALPTVSPTPAPSSNPTETPTSETRPGDPTGKPVLSPPSQPPTKSPASLPTAAPTDTPSSKPTVMPSIRPTHGPSVHPESSPTLLPTMVPTTSAPSKSPTDSPTSIPSIGPTNAPTSSPSKGPSRSPSRSPTASPTQSPTASPTQSPTASPTSHPTDAPTQGPTSRPSTLPTQGPTNRPSTQPTNNPTLAPSSSPTVSPSRSPTVEPSRPPTFAPSTSAPSRVPTAAPSRLPTVAPTLHPTTAPSKTPTASPTLNPSAAPTTAPAQAPTSCEAGDVVENISAGTGNYGTLTVSVEGSGTYFVTFRDPVTLTGVEVTAGAVSATDACGNIVFVNENGVSSNLISANVSGVKTLTIDPVFTGWTPPSNIAFTTICAETLCTTNFDLNPGEVDPEDVIGIAQFSASRRLQPDSNAGYIGRDENLGSNALFIASTTLEPYSEGGTITVVFFRDVCPVSVVYSGDLMGGSVTLFGIDGTSLGSKALPTSGTEIQTVSFDLVSAVRSMLFDISGSVYVDDLKYRSETTIIDFSEDEDGSSLAVGTPIGTNGPEFEGVTLMVYADANVDGGGTDGLIDFQNRFFLRISDDFAPNGQIQAAFHETSTLESFTLTNFDAGIQVTIRVQTTSQQVREYIYSPATDGNTYTFPDTVPSVTSVTFVFEGAFTLDILEFTPPCTDTGT